MTNEAYQNGNNTRSQTPPSSTSTAPAPQAPVGAPKPPTSPTTTTPQKPTTPEDDQKAQQIADRLASQTDLRDDTFAQKVTQNLGMVGKGPNDAESMSALVRQKLVGMGKLKETITTEDVSTNRDYYRDILDLPQFMHGFEVMMNACGFHESSANSVYRSMIRTGEFERKLHPQSVDWYVANAEKIKTACLPCFEVEIVGEGADRSIIVTMSRQAFPH